MESGTPKFTVAPPMAKELKDKPAAAASRSDHTAWDVRNMYVYGN